MVIVNSSLFIKQNGKTATASFNSIRELTSRNAIGFKNKLLKVVTTKNSVLEINLSDIEFIDSSTINDFNIISRMARKYGSYVFLSHVEPTLMELFELIRLYSVLDIHRILVNVPHKNNPSIQIS